MPKVCIDAGHGGTDPGAINGTRLEKDDNLRLALELDKQFRAQSWETVTPRKEDIFLKLAVRTSIANSKKCDLFLSVHRDASQKPSTNGASIYLHTHAPMEYVNLAAGILYTLATIGFVVETDGVTHVKRGSGADPNSDFAVNRDTVMPSMLLELGFITNAEDNKIFDGNIPQICEAIVRGCCGFLNVPYKEPEPEEKPYVLKLETLKAQGFTSIEITL
jgi:N-acetylmuramoyl-L-alanine amidase